MNKKIILSGISFFLLIGCFGCKQTENYSEIPLKNDPQGVSIEASSVNTQNIDNYLFRDDVVYVDLRPYAEIAKEGHIAGFGFYPFYDFIATMEGSKDTDGSPKDNRLFIMKNERGKLGQVGNFEPNYVESVQILNTLFPKDKYIFAITISCNESIYFLNLLIQYGYQPEKLYNIGGFSIGTGLENKAYVNIENPKYLVKGNALIPTSGQNVTFNFMKELTPVDKDYERD